MLARRCREETARYRRREACAEGYGLELFRRAIVQRDDDAWADLHTQYAPAVRTWLRLGPDAVDEGTAATFERFWRAMDAAKFARFGSLGAVLQYLKMCALTVRLDRARARRASGRAEPLDEAAQAVAAPEAVEDMVLARLSGGELWARVRRVVADERERQVLYFSCVLGLSPREICARHGSAFPTVAEIYRLKRKGLDRLARAPEIQELWCSH